MHRILREVLRETSGSQKVEDRQAASPWSKRREHHSPEPSGGPIPIDELHKIAEESSQSERRADEAERGLMEWKKVKFMQDRVGEDFDGLIISVTKYGFFVELTDLFIEGLVPLASLSDDRYNFHENTREIIGQRGRKIYSLGQRCGCWWTGLNRGEKDPVCRANRKRLKKPQEKIAEPFSEKTSVKLQQLKHSPQFLTQG